MCAGLIGITAPCDCVEPWAAIAIGFGAGLFFIMGSWILDKLKVDDPVDAIPGHFFAGIWGVLSVGIFDAHQGLVSTSPQRWQYLKWEIIGLFSIMGWAGSLSFIYFFTAKKLGRLRVHPVVEIIGLDRAYFGGLSKKDLRALE